jgi:hypothetical protein
LNGPCTSDLTGTHIDGQHFSSRTNLLGEIESGDPMARGNIEDPQTRSKVEVLQ